MTATLANFSPFQHQQGWDVLFLLHHSVVHNSMGSMAPLCSIWWAPVQPVLCPRWAGSDQPKCAPQDNTSPSPNICIVIRRNITPLLSRLTVFCAYLGIIQLAGSYRWPEQVPVLYNYRIYLGICHTTTSSRSHWFSQWLLNRWTCTISLPVAERWHVIHHCIVPQSVWYSSTSDDKWSNLPLAWLCCPAHHNYDNDSPPYRMRITTAHNAQLLYSTTINSYGPTDNVKCFNVWSM